MDAILLSCIQQAPLYFTGALQRWLAGRLEQSSSPSAPCMHATGVLSSVTARMEQDMRPTSSCTATRECTPGLASVKLPNSPSLSSLSWFPSFSLSFKLELVEPSYRSAASHGLWGAVVHASYTLFLSLPILSLLHSNTASLSLPERERERERFTSARAWPRALFLGCLVLTLFCNSVAPHGVTCTSASPAFSLLTTPLLIHDNNFTCCLLVRIDYLADLNLHPFKRDELFLFV